MYYKKTYTSDKLLLSLNVNNIIKGLSYHDIGYDDNNIFPGYHSYISFHGICRMVLT